MRGYSSLRGHRRQDLSGHEFTVPGRRQVVVQFFAPVRNAGGVVVPSLDPSP
jgi:hypothetical protein